MKQDTFKTSIIALTLLIILMIFSDKGYQLYKYNYPFAYEGECVQIIAGSGTLTKLHVLKNDFINGNSKVIIHTNINGIEAFFTTEVSNRLVKEYNPKKVSCE